MDPLFGLQGKRALVVGGGLGIGRESARLLAAQGASIAVLDLLESAEGAALRARLHDNCVYFRAGMEQLGFSLVPGEHAIIPVKIGRAHV